MTYRFGPKAIAIAASLAVATATATIPATVPVAAAVGETNDAMPHGLYVQPSPEGEEFWKEFKTFQTISLARHTFHTAARKARYDLDAPDEYYRTLYDVHERSEYACYIAKARMGLALLKYEGNEAAQGIDTAKVGLDLAESEKAYPLLKEAESEAFKMALASDDSDPHRKAKNYRHQVFQEGSGKLNDYIQILKGEDKRALLEYDPYAVIDWGIPEGWFEKAVEVVDPTPEALALTVTKADGDYVDLKKLVADSAANKESLDEAISAMKPGDGHGHGHGHGTPPADSDEPKQEEPKVEDPKQEDPNVEDPKQEDPKQEDPKQEDPKPETGSMKEILGSHEIVLLLGSLLGSLGLVSLLVSAAQRGFARFHFPAGF
ncbi:hypothetical protein CPHO_00565 [Corynebacterium phocae]|uniref:Uncharacterized protein n=1 Tax=Corynebacterium phocae TaxID=161895 RepID=A0A1L7D0I7_9CORY|nr:hypothetical protein [Corynebacterium phocae]APT91666.1 hypothetical protein CPHO_00565 [Corynebacterium phocae]KAA8728643.1 hypothetical protein F4V58_00120 [Corynebacterium phocae]